MASDHEKDWHEIAEAFLASKRQVVDLPESAAWPPELKPQARDWFSLLNLQRAKSGTEDDKMTDVMECGVCRAKRDSDTRLVAGPYGYICEHCVAGASAQLVGPDAFRIEIQNARQIALDHAVALAWGCLHPPEADSIVSAADTFSKFLLGHAASGPAQPDDNSSR